MAKLSKLVSVPISRFMQLRLKAKIVLVAAVVVFFSSGMIIVSEQPGFCNSCHIMNTYYDSWKTSSHSQVNCLDCHLKPGLMGHVRGKINGLSQAVDCIVGRVGTKPNAAVLDISCLRSECHQADELASKQLEFGRSKFTHEKHIGKEVGGMNITCGTCHSHFEGDEHFKVNRDVCFTCHFVKDSKSEAKLVQTDCLDCHDPPDKVIERGLVTVNHKEFASYDVSCEESCHKGQVEKISSVEESVCLNCHDFGMDEAIETEELHKSHSEGEKVECFACHGKTAHGPTEDAPLAAMMDCKSCHSDTHNIQFGMYTAKDHAQGSDRLLSPMFLTHVECTGCHIEPKPVKSGSIESIGTIAKAVPEACDKCHEPGTGQQYIPFWQESIKKLHGRLSQRLDELETLLEAVAEADRAKKLKEAIARARELLDSVEADGSWGVHNLKYTEAILLKAGKIIGEIQ